MKKIQYNSRDSSSYKHVKMVHSSNTNTNDLIINDSTIKFIIEIFWRSTKNRAFFCLKVSQHLVHTISYIKIFFYQFNLESIENFIQYFFIIYSRPRGESRTLQLFKLSIIFRKTV